MNRRDFDAWREMPVGRWFFDQVLQGYADEAAKENGRAVGSLEETQGKEFMSFVKNAGHISGVEYVINLDPFDEERQELDNEDQGGG